MRSGKMKKSYERKPSPERKEFRNVADSMLIPVVELDLELSLEYANPAITMAILAGGKYRINCG